MSLRAVQREAVLDALRWGHGNNNNSEGKNNSSKRFDDNNNDSSSFVSSAWRVLILDEWSRDVIAPLLKVKELRELAGVTLHLSLTKPRQAVAGAPAIYLCMPSERNVDEIAKDVVEGLFSEFRIQFLAAAPRTVLERLAKGLQDVSSIHNVFVADRALNYVALQNDLFTVPHCERIVQAFNSKHLNEKELDSQVRFLAQSLSHVAASISPSAPFVSYCRSSAGSAAELVAQRLHATLHDHIKEKTYFASSSANAPAKTLFLIVDRMSDLLTSLHHHFSYRHLLTDALGMKLNKIVVKESSSNNNNAQVAALTAHHKDEKQLEVDPEHDLFWNEHSERDFGDVHTYVDAALASFQKEHHALMASEGMSSSGDSATDLAKLMQAAPKLADRKRSVDTHTLLAFQCLKAIKSRHLDEFRGVEQTLLHPSSLSMDTPTLEKLLEGGDGITQADKERLLLMLYLAATDSKNGNSDKTNKEWLAYVERHLSALERTSTTSTTNAAEATSSQTTATTGAALFPALAFLKKLRSFSTAGFSKQHQESSSSSGGFGAFTDFFSKFSFGGDKTACPVSRVAESIYQSLLAAESGKRNASGEVIFLDPRLRDASNVGEQALLRSSGGGVNHLVVFVVGGVSPIEYEDLRRWTETKSKNGNSSSTWQLTVGGTEVLSGEGLLSQLTELGKE